METPSTAPRTERAAMRRTVALVITSAVLGALVGGGVVFLIADGLSGRTGKPSASKQPSAAASKIPNAPSSDTASKQASAGSEWSSPLAAARQMVAAGRLRDAQEEYLSILLIEPTHEEAMRGLVRVVGLIARGDRTALRRQADDYRRAIALGLETEEHYTAPAMELLARASLQAAGVRTAAFEPKPEPAPAPTARPSAAPRPEPNPQPRPTPPPVRSERPRPAPTPQAPPAQTAPAQSATPPQPAPSPPAVVDVNEPFVTVVIGPVSSSDRASAITGELTIAGYAARLRRQAAGSYVITLGPYRQSEAARAAGYVKSRFGQSLAVVLTPVP